MKLSRSSFGPLLLAYALSLAVLAPLASPAAPGSAAPAQQATLTVFAASSLTDAFKEIGQAFEAAKSTPVTFNFGASTQLRTQLQQGASADVFASADQAQMNNARSDGSIAGPDVIFARNRLVVITPKDNPGKLQSAADLANPGIRFVTAAPEVPIGVYTQNMFDKMSQISVFGADFKDRANANIVSREPNVRQVVAKVQLGEADAAVVYRSDVTPTSAPDLMVDPDSGRPEHAGGVSDRPGDEWPPAGAGPGVHRPRDGANRSVDPRKVGVHSGRPDDAGTGPVV